jgi:4-hydroxybenzoate polyprenyltransferase
MLTAQSTTLRISFLHMCIAAVRASLVLLARGNLLLAFSVAASVWLVQVMARLPVEPITPLIAFLVIYAIYSLDRAAEADTADRLTHPERARFCRRNARLMQGSALVAYGVALVLAARLGHGCFAVALLPLAAVLLYSFPFLPAPIARRVGFSRLKEVLVLKNVVVAATLTALPTLLPVVAAGGVVDVAPVWTVGLFLFARWWANTVLFDVRDEAGDRANGIRTVPVVLGGARTLGVLHSVNTVLALVALAAPLFALVPVGFAFLGVSSLYAWSYLRRIASGGDMHFLCDVVCDGELLVLVGGLVLVVGAAPLS